MPEYTFDNATIEVRDGRIVIVTPDPQPFPITDRIDTVSELQTAINDKSTDITMSGQIVVTPQTAITNIPRNTPVIIRGESGSSLVGTGEDFHIFSAAQGTGGDLTLIGVTIDGGGRKNPGECVSDDAANFFLPSFDNLTMIGCTTQHSRRTGILATNTKKLTLLKCVGYSLPRDFIWCNGSLNVLIEDCVVTYCGDDGIGCHLNQGQSASGRTVVVRNNTLYGTLGIKVLGGGEVVLIEGNKIVNPGFYGIRLGIDSYTGEGTSPGSQKNISVRGNTIENVQRTSPCHPGQEMGFWIWMEAPGIPVTNLFITGNRLIKTDDAGKLVSAMYQFASDGAYTKTGLDPSWKMDMGVAAIRLNCPPSPSIVVKDNVMVGVWK